MFKLRMITIHVFYTVIINLVICKVYVFFVTAINILMIFFEKIVKPIIIFHNIEY